MTVRSNLNSKASPKIFGSVFYREFTSKDRLSNDISSNRFPNRLNCLNITSDPATIPLTMFLRVGYAVYREKVVICV
ncbi:hypothetical protein DPMN_145314 [Dreissena polymorpha]|uniref:Uncharacterized protein n=1 Tax=Dreissena polymorpha TaxID=45954 RepID=A0A9D4J0X5_DREPO|nr:hypothetical protein DPMN_145314 [Dreissena polymorpha]